MFSREIYIQRRENLLKKVKSGIILMPGNDEVPMNYAGNTYYFRQDSSFLYYFGIDQPSLTGVIDVDDNEIVLFGDDPGLDDIMWMGPQDPILDLASEARIERAMDVILEGRTAVIIAHRLTTAMRADRIAVIHDGQILELGPMSAQVRRHPGGMFRTQEEDIGIVRVLHDDVRRTLR